MKENTEKKNTWTILEGRVEAQERAIVTELVASFVILVSRSFLQVPAAGFVYLDTRAKAHQ